MGAAGQSRSWAAGARQLLMSGSFASLLILLSLSQVCHGVSVSGLLQPANTLVHSSQELLSAVLLRMQPVNVAMEARNSKAARTWALLVAGSSGWENYRHQADVLRAYHIVRRNGIRPENIVTMLYDDLAYNESNPYPGLVFNEPGGPDVYQGVPIDYKGKDISARTFLDVLLGNKTAVEGKGSGKVINSGPNDKVFVFYSDHGSVGLLKFPVGRDLTARQLLESIKLKFAKKAYKQMVFYLESCYSGSMFSGMHPHDWNVFAVTAARPDQLSYATHCRGDSSNSQPGIGWNSMIDTNNIYACLGDEFSVAWMQDSETVDITGSTLQSQYERVRDTVRDSNVMLYGDKDLGTQPISNAQGGTSLPELQGAPKPTSNAAGGKKLLAFVNAVKAFVKIGGRRMLLKTTDSAANGTTEPASAAQAAAAPSLTRRVSQLDADLLGLQYVALSSPDPERRQYAEERYNRAVTLRAAADKAADNAAKLLLSSSSTSNKVTGLAQAHLPSENPEKWAVVQNKQNSGVGVGIAAVEGDSSVADTYAQQLIYGMNGRNADGSEPVVDDWDCFEGMIDVWTEQVGIWTNYARRHTRFFANLCNAGVTPEQFKQTLAPPAKG